MVVTPANASLRVLGQLCSGDATVMVGSRYPRRPRWVSTRKVATALPLTAAAPFLAGARDGRAAGLFAISRLSGAGYPSLIAYEKQMQPDS